MNAEIKAKWVAALRSGKYAQTRGALCNTKVAEDHKQVLSYCCLGVLCDITYPNQWAEPAELNVGQEYPRMHSGFLGLPSPTLYGEIGLYPSNLDHNLPVIGLTDRKGNTQRITELNDSGEFNFSQMADIIEHFF
jgi:hypothetical protein